jgi:hypothetical protein
LQRVRAIRERRLACPESHPRLNDPLEQTMAGRRNGQEQAEGDLGID